MYYDCFKYKVYEYCGQKDLNFSLPNALSLDDSGPINLG